jgi:hypothetical protein
MGKSWKERPDKNYKRQKHHKKERSWNTRNHIEFRKEKQFEKSHSPFDDSQEYHESFS